MEFFIMLFLAFCGGTLAAAIGALGAFAFVGLTGLIGIAMAAAGADFDWLGLVTFGPYFGPHISFGAGCAAAAYARKMGYMESGKDIVKALISLRRPDVLIIGGVFGILARLIEYGLSQVMTGMLDTVATTVFLLALISKVAFGNLGLREVFGVVPDEIKKVGGRFSVLSNCVWLSWQNTAMETTILSITAGGLSAYVTYAMLQNTATAGVAPFVGFSIGVTAFFLLLSGITIPIFHHISLGASYAVLMSGSLVWGIAGGIIGGFAGDLLAKAFHCHGDTHVDPPGMSITFTSLLFFTIVPWFGLYGDPVFIPGAIIVLAILYSFYQQSYIRKNKDRLIGCQKECVFPPAQQG